MRRIFIVSSLLASGYALSALPPPTSSAISLPQPAVSKDWLAPPIYPIQKVSGDPVAEFAKQRVEDVNPDANLTRSYEPVYTPDLAVYQLPSPTPAPGRARVLSLYDAIALALRGNPTIEVSELQRILDKFGMELIAQAYRVQWSPLTLTSTLQNRVMPVWAAGGGVSLTAPTGTNIALAQTNNLLGGPGNTTLTVTQPLLQGFGTAFNLVSYRNGIDSERVARLTFKNSVITVVIAVIKAYRSLVAAYNSLDVSRQSLASQEAIVRRAELQVKAGQMAPADLTQQKANIESTRLSVVQSENSLRNAYQSFLSALGLTPSADILIDHAIKIDQVKIPDLPTCIQTALKNNIAYQTQLIQFNITKRALITAQNARKWTLNLVSAATVGAQRSAVGSPITSSDTNPTLKLSLSIPIDNITAKQGEESAKIGIEDAKINLEQTKEQLVRQVINQWEGIRNQRRQVDIAALGVQLQEKTLANAKLKLKYGRSSVFETNTLETDLLSQQVGLINEKISYLNDATDLYQTMGLTLDKWKITLKY